MKTKFLTRFSFSEDDKKNLILIQEMDENLFALIESHFINAQSVRSPFDKEVRKLVEDSKTNPDIVGNSLNAVYGFIYMISREVKEDIKDVIDDITDLYSDIIKDKSVFVDRLTRIGKITAQYRLLFRTKSVKAYGSPLLKDINACVIIKPVFEEPFDFDEIDIKEYNPKKINQVACVLLEIRNSYDDYINFQVDANDYERLLNELIAIQIELKTFENDCN